MALQTVTAIIASDCKEISAYFAWSSTTKLRSLLIDYRCCPANTDMLGKWVKMALDERDRAQGPVEILPDVFETRISLGVVEVRVNFQHDGRFEDRFEMYYNEHFGYICDPRIVLPHPETHAWYNGWIVRHKEKGINGRWRLSTQQDRLKPLFNSSDNSSDNFECSMERSRNNLEIVRAIVRSRVRHDGSYLAWSKSRPKSTICIDTAFCSNVDLFGRWVEVVVDKKNRAQKPVTLIEDVFPTRIRGRVVEILVEFRQISNNQTEIFHHDYFGYIRDDMYVIQNFKKDGLYRGWIKYDQEDNMSERRWRVALNQNVVEFSNSDGHLFDNGTQQRRSRCVDEFDDTPRRRSRSLEKRTHADHYSRRSSNEYSNNERRRRSFSPELRPDTKRNVKSYATDHERLHDEQPDRHGFETRFSHSPVPSYSSSVRQIENNETAISKEQASSAYKTNSKIFPILKLSFHVSCDPNLSKAIEKPMETLDALNKTLQSLDNRKNKNEEKHFELEQRHERISEIVAFFRQSEKICHLMRQMNVEQYDELLELTHIDDVDLEQVQL